MSNQLDKAALVRAIGHGIQALQETTDALDEAVAECMGINRTDMRLLSILDRCGPMTLGALGAEGGLSKPAMTSAIDRLERAGHVRREPSAVDRRSVTVTMTEPARRQVRELYGPIGAQGAELLGGLSLRDLGVLHHFLEAADALQKGHAARIRAMRQRRIRGRPRG
jgi:DNA-binding MarR family transcriptional regulator